MNKIGDLINNLHDDVEEKPQSKTPVKIPEGANENEVRSIIDELESLKPLLGNDPKYYERFIELLSELEQYFSIEEIAKIAGIEALKDNKEYTVTLTTEEFGSMLSFAVSRTLKVDYPQLKDDPKILNIISSVGAILWNLITHKS